MNYSDTLQGSEDKVVANLQAEVKNLRRELAATRNEKNVLSRISTTVDLDLLLNVFAEEIEKLSFFDAYMINFEDENKENLICVKVRLPEDYRFMERTYKNFHFSIEGDFINVHAYRENRALLVDKLSINNYSSYVQSRFERWKVQELIAIPILAADTGKPIGSIMAYCQNNKVPTQSEKELYRLAKLFSVQLRNAQEYNRLKVRESHVDQVAAEQQRFMEFAAKLNSLTSRDEIFNHVATGLIEQLPFELLSLYLLEDNKLHCKINQAASDIYFDVYKDWNAFLEKTPFELNESDGGISVCFAKNQDILIPDVTKVRHLPMSRKDEIALKTLSSPRTFYFIPIRLNDQAIGVIRLASVTRVIDLKDSDTKFIDLLCRFIGPAIRNAENYELIDSQKQKIETLNANLQSRVDELAKIATIDKLTGLNNYRSFSLEFDRIFENQNLDSPLNFALIVADIDHFKNFNDTHGHNAGNEVLIGVADKLKSLTRTFDIACRYGGEEFVVILPRCDMEGAQLFSERLRASVEESIFETSEGKLSVTISVGFGCHTSGENKEQLFEKVDKALYQAKDLGRNRIQSALTNPSDSEK